MESDVYLLWHSHGEDDENAKLLGVYSSKSAAYRRLQEAKRLPGFRLFPDGFHISRYEVDKDRWTEGFAIQDMERWGIGGEMAWVDDPDPEQTATPEP